MEAFTIDSVENYCTIFENSRSSKTLRRAERVHRVLK